MTIFHLKVGMWIVQIMALIFAIIYWKHYKNTFQRHFLVLLFFIVVSEISATIVKEVFGLRSFPIYNLLSIFSFLFYLFLFKNNLDKKQAVNGLLILFCIATLFSAYKDRFIHGFMEIMWITGAVTILISSFMFYLDLLNNKEVIKYKSTPKFWIATGLLIYHIGYLPLLLFKDYIGANTFHYRVPVLILNIILYGSFIKSFLCWKPQNI